MKQAITHENFPQFITALENAGAQIKGRRFGRILASIVNAIISCAVSVLTVCAICALVDPEAMSPPEAFSHIPEFFLKAGKWALGLFPEDWNDWLCLPVMLCAIPVSGLVTGLIFRWIPFQGKADKVEGETPTEKTDKAIELANKLRSKYLDTINEFTYGTMVAAAVVGVAILALPIISVCRAAEGMLWYMVLASVVIMLLQMCIILCIALCVFCFCVFWLAFAQEWVTSLFYRCNGFKKELQLLEDYRKLLEQEEKADHEAQIARIENEAIGQLRNGKLAAALKTLSSIEEEAKDQYYIREMVQSLAEEKRDVDDWCRWLKWKEEDIHAEALRAFLREEQERCRQKLLKRAEEDYPKALQCLEEEDFREAATYLKAADAIDYRDGVALLAYTDLYGGYSYLHDSIIKRLTYGMEKGIETEKWEIRCLNALKRAEEGKREAELAAFIAEQEREKAMQALGKQIIDNFTCEYLVNGYCCRYTTIDNFPHGCYWVGRPRDMYTCSDRRS